MFARRGSSRRPASTASTVRQARSLTRSHSTSVQRTASRAKMACIGTMRSPAGRLTCGRVRRAHRVSSRRQQLMTVRAARTGSSAMMARRAFPVMRARCQMQTRLHACGVLTAVLGAAATATAAVLGRHTTRCAQAASPAPLGLRAVNLRTVCVRGAPLAGSPPRTGRRASTAQQGLQAQVGRARSTAQQGHSQTPTGRLAEHVWWGHTVRAVLDASPVARRGTTLPTQSSASSALLGRGRWPLVPNVWLAATAKPAQVECARRARQGRRRHLMPPTASRAARTRWVSMDSAQPVHLDRNQTLPAQPVNSA